MIDEGRDIRIKRLAMRSMRRGIKEMDLILSDFAGDHLDGMSDEELDLYEALLEESDHDLYRWVSGQDHAPDRFSGLVARIASGAIGVSRPR